MSRFHSAALRLARWFPGLLALLGAAMPVFGANKPPVLSRHAVVLGIHGMKEFLAASPQVDLEKEWDSQFQALTYDLGHRDQFRRFAAETFRPESLIADGDRDPADVVLRRTMALLIELKATVAAPALAPLEKELAGLQAAVHRVPPADAGARYALFARACRLRRQIAMRNPLLDFDHILFIKRHRSQYDHMCDQYYGVTAQPGGGLFVLTDSLGPKAAVREVLAGSTVAGGRLKGQGLRGGSFVTASLSYDAAEVLFAYVECSGDTRQDIHTDPTRGHWSPGRAYHLFKVNVDGTNLRQLTDGTWNDFAPCWLPNGRIAFITERRGGYLRCGRECPTYTLFDMAPDGSDINCLSFHETNEWHPSVTHDGRIIYTRWDYVDRYGCTAHLPWITTLDGRDSRAVHGNFAPRGARPDMEMNVRAVPGSHKYVATAAPHHGQAFGSLVLIDPRSNDRDEDDAMAPVKRLTPDVGFPESQGGMEAYGTAWPLSEDFYLCVYDAGRAMGRGGAAYGLYLVDSLGNKELLYRDAAIGCETPIPVRATLRPPVAPSEIKPGARINPSAQPDEALKPAEGTLAVINVYDSLKPWPAGTKITQLRVYQVLPMTVPSGYPPHETALRIAGAGDSVVAARSVLGTVPVETDGSAHFVAPANKELFFQALDPRGMAVQSMRSASYLHEGERLVCQGCHEPKHSSPRTMRRDLLAFHRPPSRIEPDVDGSNPFSYPRLVQPVLERLCVDCHAKNAGKAPNLAREPITNHWYASFANLAPRYGFHDYGSPLRTTPGKFGAKASRLVEILERGHYDLKLSREDFHRITLWLDSATMFYGVYEKEGGQKQLSGGIARPTLQ